MATTSASSVDNYTANRLDRTRNGGGVITYVNNSFSSKPLENYQNDFNKLELEITVTEVTLNTLQKTIILGVYRARAKKKFILAHKATALPLSQVWL